MIWKRLSILSNVLFIMFGIASIMLALTSFMLFDAPGSENNILVWIVFWCSLALPITCGIAVISSLLVFFKSRRYKKSFFISLTPTILLAIIAVCFVLNDIYCGGTLSCSVMN